MSISRWIGTPLLVAAVAAMAALSGCDTGDGNGGGGGGKSSSASHNDVGNNNPDVYVAMGDSITLGANKPYPSWPQRLSEILGKSVVNSAEIGESAAGGAARVGGVLARWKPGYLLIMYGINEMRLGNTTAGAENVRSIIRQAKANKTVPLVATYYMMGGESAGLNPGIRDLDRQLREVAKAEGAILVDVEADFGDNDAGLLYFPEAFHPNDAGTIRIAQNFANAL